MRGEAETACRVPEGSARPVGPPLPRLRPAVLAVPFGLAVLLLAVPHPAVPADPHVLDGTPAAGEALDRGMPLAAEAALRALPAPSRALFPLLPGIMAALTDAGHAGRAIALFEEARASLAEPLRSEAFLAAGKIHWARGEFGRAEAAFREVGGKGEAASEAAAYLARLLAAAGETGAAARTLARAPAGARRDAVARRIGGPGEGTSGADGPPATPLGEAVARLTRGDAGGARAAAREAAAASAAASKSVLALPPWDGTRAGAHDAWSAMVALYPDGEPAGPFISAGRRFLAAAALADAAGDARNGARRLSLRLRAAREGLAARARDLDGTARRVEEAGRRLRELSGRADALPGGLARAADDLPLAAWGASADPRGSALLRDLEGRTGALMTRLAAVEQAFDRKLLEGWSPPLAPEDRLTVLQAQGRLARLGDRIEAASSRAAFLRVRLVNRWKSMAVDRIAPLRGKADEVAAAVGAEGRRAERAALPVPGASREVSRWSGAVDRYAVRLDRLAAGVDARRSEAEALAARGHAEARQALAGAVARRERAARYIAGRAAFESLAAGGVRDPGARGPLREEGRRDLEAALPPPGEAGPPADEILYALAELAYEEAEARPRGTADGPAASDFTGPAALFDRVIAEHPASPYAEPARYGLALCRDRGGDEDGAARALEELLARHPGTRFAAEAQLRLGEYEFNRYEFARAAERYAAVGHGAPPAIRSTALYKLGWSLYLTERPREALDPFIRSLAPLDGAEPPRGFSGDVIRMTARSLVEAGMERDTASLLAARGAQAHGPAVLLKVQETLDALNRYGDVAAAADAFAAAWPLDVRRVDAELAAAEALRKGGRDQESQERRSRYHAAFGPASPWQAAPGRSPADIARADTVAEEGLRGVASSRHAALREGRGGATGTGADAVLRLYDTYLAVFPAAPGAADVAFHRAWLLFEAGRLAEAGAAFEDVARRPGERAETALYMAVQSAKDRVAALGAGEAAGPALEEVVRLGGEYERFHPAGGRLGSVLADRARALFRLGRFPEAARDADRSAPLLGEQAERRAASRLAGDAWFEAGRFDGAERAFRDVLALSPPPAERREAATWAAFSMFRRAEAMPPGEAAAAARLFGRLAAEFPEAEIARTALFRSGVSHAGAGERKEAVAAFLAVEASGDPALSADATRWLARLYEEGGEAAPAADRYARLADREPAGEERARLRFRAGEILSGTDEAGSRALYVAAAGETGAPPSLAIAALFRAGESARAEGKADEADRHYEAVVRVHAKDPAAAPLTAATAYLRRGDRGMDRYRALRIAPPLEKTFAAKQSALEAAAVPYLEAARLGDAATSTAALHRLGEGLEDFKSSVLAAPPPKGLKEPEVEEYRFLLEERAAPIEEKAVEAYLGGVRRAVAAGSATTWSEKSLERLKALRPAVFGGRWEYAFPVATVPEFAGIVERAAP